MKITADEVLTNVINGTATASALEQAVSEASSGELRKLAATVGQLKEQVLGKENFPEKKAEKLGEALTGLRAGLITRGVSIPSTKGKKGIAALFTQLILVIEHEADKTVPKDDTRK